eukprot:2181244-Ditylum_brightwellii.AAC.1
MGTSRISPLITETTYSHSMMANYWTSWNMEYHRHDIESLPCMDLTQWIKVQTTPRTKSSQGPGMQGNTRLTRLINPQWPAACVKPDETQKDADKVTYKDLNAFVKAKVTAALNKAKTNLKKQKKEKEVELNAFDKCCTLNIESSNEEDKPS